MATLVDLLANPRIRRPVLITLLLGSVIARVGLEPSRQVVSEGAVQRVTGSLVTRPSTAPAPLAPVVTASSITTTVPPVPTTGAPSTVPAPPLTAAAPTPAPPPGDATVGAHAEPSACPITAVEAQLLDLVNAARLRSGLRALAWDERLACLADRWSLHMAHTGDLVHSDLAAALRAPEFADYAILGENILRGSWRLDAQAMHDGWMSSPTHRANVLSDAYTRIGIGLVSSGRVVYVTQSFG